jgi:hypothetical protein
MGAWKNATPSTVTLTRVHDDDVYPDGELGQLVVDDDLEADEPGGGIQNAFVGTPSDPPVWVNAVDQQVMRDEDGTYVIRIN